MLHSSRQPELHETLFLKERKEGRKEKKRTPSKMDMVTVYVIPALGRQKQQDLLRFEASLMQ